MLSLNRINNLENEMRYYIELSELLYHVIHMLYVF
jgi:hypothetical protein